jgi:hypothetical protein
MAADYKIVKANDEATLEIEVKVYLTNGTGWKVAGGIVYGDLGKCYQTIYKEA